MGCELRRVTASSWERFAAIGKHGARPQVSPTETIYFLGFTLYCTRNQKGNFRIAMLTEESRLRRAHMRLQDQMRRMRHSSLQEQANHLNQMHRGHYAYYGIAGNLRALLRVYRAVERYWRKMLRGRSWPGAIRWEQFQRIKNRFHCFDQSCISPTGRCRLSPYREPTSDEPSAGNPHAGFCGSRRWVTTSGHPVGDQ
jgi:predicted DCC family thiol-disulfide oxidoreductase YuxK